MLEIPTGRRASTVPPPCAIDRLPRRRRNELCIGVIALGLLNFIAYTISYALLGGDARNGHVATDRSSDPPARVFFVGGHFIHDLSGRQRAVSREAWIYSYVHSITVPLTSAALIISMLVLARPHIVATMRNGLLTGRAFIAAFSAVVLLITAAITSLFVWDFIEQLSL